MPTLKIDHARYILTLDPRRQIISDGAIVLDGQRITHVGKAADLARIGADRVIDAAGMVITPGFFNGHMHISYAHAVRGIFPDDVENRLIHVFNLQAAMTEEEEYYTSLLAIVELLKGGTVCFVDPGSTKFPEACMQAYEDSGIRIILGEAVTDRQFPWKLPCYPADEAIARTRDFIRTYDGRLAGRVRAWAMPFSPESCSDGLLTALKHVVDEHGTFLTLHHNITAKSRDASLAAHGKHPTEHLEDIGVLGSNVLLAHVMGLADAEIECLARTRTNAVMCPSTVVKQGGGIGPNGKLPELLDRGVTVTLGTDSANSSNYLDIVRAMNMAAVVYKDARQDSRMIPAETALELVTLQGARAFGLGDDLGSIEAGKKADLVLFDTNRPEWQSLFDPVNNLVYSADSRSVHTVIVDGRVVVDAYQQSFVDERKLFAKVQEIGENLLARSDSSFRASRWPVV